VKTLKIVVCVKDVPDPEGPKSAFDVRQEEKKVVPVGIPPVINPYDENALELSLHLKERWGGTIVALNVSKKAKTSVLKKALSVGADELVLVEDDSFEDLSSRSTAEILGAAINKIGPYDLVLTGRQAVDWESGQTGLFLAEVLGIPALNLVRAAAIDEDGIRVEKLKRFGYEVVQSPLPALLTVSSEAGELRLPTLKAIQEARKRPVTLWRAADLQVDSAKLWVRKIGSLSAPTARSRDCCFVEGETLGDRGRNLALRLRQDGVL
jgi:electron transfer flavoprotein beta subunit